MVPQYLISALVYACLFALMGMGLTLTYMTTKVPNFAYGDFVALGVYSAYTASKVFHSNPYVGSVFGFAIGAVASAIMYLGVLRPLAKRGSSMVSLMIATFGVDIGFVGLIGIYTDYLQYVQRLIDAAQFYQLGPDFSFGGYAGVVYAAPISVIATVAAIYLLFTRTKFGVAMRAAVENPPLARVLGINVDLVNTISWMLAGGLAAYAGALLTLQLPAGTATGSNLIVEIFSASVLGGLNSIFGAAVGGLLIGGSEILLTLDLGLGFGYAGAVVISVLLILAGVFVFKMKKVQARIAGAVLAAFGAWILIDMAAGFPVDFLSGELVFGFGPNVTPYQQAIPLLIMAFSLMIIPEGIFSIDFRRLLKRVKS
ncbi:MAG: branched-chain amino acid ABC transporter permease [Thaumarchaeota archaeon]|nr:branched-chain amino acid ABC transporter permease [Nitrososphaerota archaeon]